MNHVKVFKKVVVDEWQFIQYQGDAEAIENYIKVKGLRVESRVERPEDPVQAERGGWQDGEELWFRVIGEAGVQEGYVSNIIMKKDDWLVIKNRRHWVVPKNGVESFMDDDYEMTEIGG